VVAAEVSLPGFLELGLLVSHLAHGHLGHDRGVALSGDERFDHVPPRDGQDLGGHRAELDAGVLEHLLHALGLGGAHVHDGFATPGQGSQLADGRRRHQTGPDHPRRHHIG
jgi:hypothetical protein